MNNETITAVPVITPLAGLSLEAPLSRIEQHLSIIERRIESSPVIVQHPASSIAPLPYGIQQRVSCPHIRNGKIARLPKLERDMVNRMLFNHIPYAKIVGALGEHGIYVTQRNVSNWKTRGGYKEWCSEQERQLQLSSVQDHLTDYLRKNDAGQLPEVGLQVAATQLSLSLLRPETAQQLAADPQKYSQVVDMLCRLSTQIQALQKDRNEAVKKAAIRNTSEHLKRQEEEDVEITRSVYSSKLGERPGDEIPHRNDLPRRDELPFQEPPPKGPTFREIMEHMSKTSRSKAALPAPHPKPAEKPTAEKTPPSNGSPNNGSGSPPSPL